MDVTFDNDHLIASGAPRLPHCTRRENLSKIYVIDFSLIEIGIPKDASCPCIKAMISTFLGGCLPHHIGSPIHSWSHTSPSVSEDAWTLY